MMQFEMLATGYGGVEGPRVDARNRLYFSDVVDGGVYRRSPDGSIETLIPDRKSVGGIAFNINNDLLVTGRGWRCGAKRAAQCTKCSRDSRAEHWAISMT